MMFDVFLGSHLHKFTILLDLYPGDGASLCPAEYSFQATSIIPLAFMGK
jgi:hypothetical protein